MPDSLQDRIEQTLGRRPERITPLHGGDIGEVYRVDLPGKDTIVAKVASGGSGSLDIEGMMLRYLADNSALPVPEVLHSDATLLLMTFIEGSSTLDDNAQAHAAELLAALHTAQGDNYGFQRDTLIGSLHQPNPWTSSWLVFFRDQRLFYMAREAVREGSLPSSMLARLERFCAQLDQWLYEPEYPALLHGDLWTTNILAANGRITGFIDPAVYYGHPEIELAFSTLFGTFGKPFFRRYRELHRIPPGFMELRRDLYNLYPLLVHVRLFGGTYVRSIDRILRAIGF